MTLISFRTALILAASTALTSAAAVPAWAQLPKPNFPIRLEQTASADESIPTAESEPPVRREEPPMPAQPEPEGVEARPLETPALARRAPIPPAATRAYSTPSKEVVTRAAVSGLVVDADGPGVTYKVKKGDNLAAIARKLGVDQKELARINGLKPPYRLMPGDELKGPGGGAKAYVVGKGDTLYAIARRFGVTPKEIADANHMSVNSPLAAGRKLILPDSYRDGGPAREEGEATSTRAPVDAAPPPPKATPKPRESEPPPSAGEGSTTEYRVTGKVIEVEGRATTYKVKKGDNLDAIARDMGMGRKELAQLNRLKSPFRLKPGQVLKGPPRREKAYVPVEGDTLSLIAQRFGVSVRSLAAANGLRTTAAVRAGRRLVLPSGARDRGPIRETVRGTPAPSPSYPKPQAPPPQAPVYTPPPQTPAAPPPRTEPSLPPAVPPVSGAALTDAQISALGKGRFIWPLKGDIISTFGPKGTGQRNDGINIRAQSGDFVRAAADGDVVYAGDQVPGFGNLVLIKHADGWVTAYGHLARVDVKMQQKVVQGQQLGMAGDTGGVSEVQLHFEVRYAPSPTERARPVDPQLVLGK